MARKTLEHMCGGGTYDQEWGGFYRYSTKRDWSVPHYEKMLEDNALLLRNLLKLYRIAREPQHRRYIDTTIAYMDAWLSDTESGAFYGSQDADEEFYPLPAAVRAGRPAPYVDRTIYTSWNAMAISAYLEASWTLDRRDLEDRALRALDFLWERVHADGGMCRYLAPDGPRIAGLLEDQAWTAAACLDAYEAAGRPQDLERARTLVRFLRERLAAPGGASYDTPAEYETLGRLALRQTPVKENAVAATVMARLSRITQDADLEDAARRALLPFAGIIDSQGYFAAGYATAVDVLLNPAPTCGSSPRRVIRPADANGCPRIGRPEPHRSRNRRVGSRRAGTRGAATRTIARRIRLLRYPLLGARYGAGGSGRSYPESTCGIRAHAPHRTAGRPPWRRHGERLTTRGGGP